jgi:hypothetical protein
MKTCGLARAPALAGLLLAGSLSAAACRDDRVPARVDATEGQAVVDTTALPEGIYVADTEQPDASPPPAIYYDLTLYDWYARGEPLVHETRGYAPGGLVAARGEEMDRVGEYGGVAYYRRTGAAADSLFVPVFERYWLSFVLQPSPEAG